MTYDEATRAATAPPEHDPLDPSDFAFLDEGDGRGYDDEAPRPGGEVVT